jgi:flagellar hook-basal body complex protein FliE
MTDPIQGFSPIDPSTIDRQIQNPGAPAENPSNFWDTLKDSLEHVQDLQNEADQSVTNLVTGQGEDIHAAMSAVEKADLSFQLVMQVRNKIVQAYQQVSQMQF